MDLPIEVRPPLIMPSAEDDGWRIIASYNLGHLWQYADEFGGAIALFDHAAEHCTEGVRDVYFRWVRIAARDGAMSLYHYSECLKAIRTSTGQTAWSNAIDMKALRDLAKEFRHRFPHIEVVRDGIGHSAELSASVSAIENNSVQTDDGWLFTAGSIDVAARRYTVTKKPTKNAAAEVFSYDISHEAFSFLEDNLRRVHAIFEPLAAHRQGKSAKLPGK
jgi:hypothetical protein